MRKALQAAAGAGASAAVIIGAYVAGVALAPEPVGTSGVPNPPALSTPSEDADRQSRPDDEPSDTTFEQPAEQAAQERPDRPRATGPTATSTPEPTEQRTPRQRTTADRETEAPSPQRSPTQAPSPAEPASSEPEPEPEPEPSESESDETSPTPEPPVESTEAAQPPQDAAGD